MRNFLLYIRQILQIWFFYLLVRVLLIVIGYIRSRLILKIFYLIYSLQFVSSSHDFALFVKCTDAGRIILSLYIDDMIIIGDDINVISVLKTKLAKQFEMKDLGYLRYFVSIEVAYSPRDYLLSQSKYVTDILKRAKFTDNKIVDTPIEVNAKYFFTDDLPSLDPTLYRAIVESLIYLTITHPDIAYVVHLIDKFVVSPTTIHWAAMLCILRYIRDTVFQSLLLPSTFFLERRAYSDANYGSDPTDRKSVTGLCIFLGDSLIY